MCFIVFCCCFLTIGFEVGHSNMITINANIVEALRHHIWLTKIDRSTLSYVCFIYIF